MYDSLDSLHETKIQLHSDISYYLLDLINVHAMYLYPIYRPRATLSMRGMLIKHGTLGISQHLGQVININFQTHYHYSYSTALV